MNNSEDGKLELMTINEAAEFLNIKVSNLRSAVFKRKIRYLKFGALIRFRKSDLIEWLEARLVQPINSNH
jgi:excisionase family DNA binding protein